MNLGNLFDRLLAQAISLRVAVALVSSAAITVAVAGPLAYQAVNADTASEVAIEANGSGADAGNAGGADGSDPDSGEPTSTDAKAADAAGEPQLGAGGASADTNNEIGDLVPPATVDSDASGSNTAGPFSTPTVILSEVPADSASSSEITGSAGGAESTTSAPGSTPDQPEPSVTSPTVPVQGSQPDETLRSTTTAAGQQPSSSPSTDRNNGSTTASTTVGTTAPATASTGPDSSPRGEDPPPSTTIRTTVPTTATERPSSTTPPTSEPTTSSPSNPGAGGDTTQDPPATTVPAGDNGNGDGGDDGAATDGERVTDGGDDDALTDPDDPDNVADGGGAGPSGGPTTTDPDEPDTTEPEPLLLPTEILWSNTRTGVGENPLEGALLDGETFIHLGRHPDIAAVLIWVDDPAGTTAPFLDSSSPFTSRLRVDLLSPGSHRLDVQVTLNDGSSIRLAAEFVVADDAADVTASSTAP